MSSLVPGPARAGSLCTAPKTALTLVDRRSFRLLALLGLLLASTFAVLHVDLGWSPSSSQPVAQAIVERLPATIELAAFALLTTVVLGAIAGFVRARTRPQVLRGALALLQLAVRAVPVVVLATFLQLFLVFRTSMPLAGMTSGTAFGLRDHLTHLIAPVLCLAVPFGAWSSLLFHDFFRARGNASRTRARSVIAPVAATAALVGPALLSATLLIEPRFAWPGVARLLDNGLSQIDLALVAVCLLTYSAGVVLLKLCAAFSPSSSDLSSLRDSGSPRNLASRPARISVITIVALVVLVGAALGAVGASLISAFDPNFIDQAHWQGYPLAPGIGGHVLGTDENGRDLMSRLLVALRTSLGIAAAAALIATAIGAVVATLARAVPWFDGRGALSTIGIRPFAAFPFILAAVSVLVAKFHGTGVLSPLVMTLIIAAVSWPAIVPAFRARTRATFGGVADLAACALLLEVTQSSVGFGVQPPTASLGNMLVNAQSNFTVAPWAAITPAVVTIVILSALYAVGDELRDHGPTASGASGPRSGHQPP